MRSHHTWRLKSKHQQICLRCGQVRRWDGTRWLYRKLGQLVRERPACGDRRTDSERYAELRKLVEAWIDGEPGDDTEDALLNWSHR